jgi:hypothetical protein
MVQMRFTDGKVGDVSSGAAYGENGQPIESLASALAKSIHNDKWSARSFVPVSLLV